MADETGSQNTNPQTSDPQSEASGPSMSYSSYLKVEELLSLQEPVSDPVEHDEMLFIIIHQIYELWFKEVLHEFDELIEHLDDDHRSLSGHQLKRVLRIFKTLTAQLDVLETMTPLEFVSFRRFLANSSGFQSAQFREIEFILGQKNPEHVERFVDSSREYENLVRRYKGVTLWDAFIRHAARRGYDIPTEFLERDLTQAVGLSAQVQQAVVKMYREDPPMSRLCESLIDLDEGLQEWRYRHVMMVQRTIGMKIGTGGSAGVEYLRSTLFRPAFPDLWAVRAVF